MEHIRKAAAKDASRLAEILIFTKRMNYKLETIWVYDDEFVKGMIHIEGNDLIELYVDSFFQNEGIGAKLVAFAIQKFDIHNLTVLEKNTSAIRFYQRHGFSLTQERTLEEGTTEYLVKMKR